MATEVDENWVEKIGEPTMGALRELVDALDRSCVAQEFASTLTRERCVEILTDECGIQCRDDETVDELREAVAENIADETCAPDGFEFDEDDARERIQEDPLSVEVRSDWYSLGADSNDDSRKPAEFNILLGTGGPATRIVGDLDEHGQPSRPRLQVQDWGKPWTEYLVDSADRARLLTYCQVFYFGG